MRRLIACATVSRDGCCEDARGRPIHPAWSRALGDEWMQTLERCDALLYGRVTFEHDRAFWRRADLVDLPTARLLARYPKLVASRTLPDALDWNTRVLRDPLAELPAHLRAPGKDVALFGSPTLLAAIAPLVDELRIVMTSEPAPGGRRWLPDGLERPLRDTRELGGGTVLHCYGW